MSEASQPQTADEVLRCMGRNLLISQQIEAMLKVLIENSEHVIEREEGDGGYRTRTLSVQNSTLGELARNLEKQASSDPDSEGSEDSATPVVAHTRFPLDILLLAVWRKHRAKLIRDRNELVHHFLPRWQPKCAVGIATALQWLNLQHQHMLEVHASVKSMVCRLVEARKAFASLLDKPYFIYLLDPLVLALLDFLREQAGADPRAWCSMSRAGQYLHEHHPEAMGTLRADGHKSFRAFVEATGLFELTELSTPRGGSALYLRVLQSTTGQLG